MVQAQLASKRAASDSALLRRQLLELQLVKSQLSEATQALQEARGTARTAAAAAQGADAAIVNDAIVRKGCDDARRGACGAVKRARVSAAEAEGARPVARFGSEKRITRSDPSASRAPVGWNGRARRNSQNFRAASYSYFCTTCTRSCTFTRRNYFHSFVVESSLLPRGSL